MDPNTQTEEIQEGELVQNPESPSSNGDGDAIVLLNLESLIRGHISSIEKLQVEARKHKEMIDNALNNDPTYKEHFEKAKEANQIKTATKAQIFKQPSMMMLVNKVKNMKAEQRELQTELSEYLKEFQRLSGANEIEDEQGELREIINEAKLIKKSAKK